MGTLLTGEGGLWLMPSSQGRGAYQVHLCDDHDGGEDEDDDDCGVGAGGRKRDSIFTILPGDIHFDDGENWTLGSYRGINLTQVETFFFTDMNIKPYLIMMSDIPRWQFTRLVTVWALSIQMWGVQSCSQATKDTGGKRSCKGVRNDTKETSLVQIRTELRTPNKKNKQNFIYLHTF